jgi:hypothetical protein
MERLKRAIEGAGKRARPLVLFLIVPALAACAGGGGTQRLLDGSRPPAPPPTLPAAVVMTRARSLQACQIEPRLLRACLHLVAPARLAGVKTIVQRLGIDGGSLTFRGGGPWVRACDAAVPPRGQAGVWCGGAVGRLRPDGTLFDPRLDLACRDAKGRQIGFAWVDPVPGATYVAVQNGKHVEIYPTAGKLPVRVTTTDVSAEAASATFRVTQYTAGGRELSSETLRVVVAG